MRTDQKLRHCRGAYALPIREHSEGAIKGIQYNLRRHGLIKGQLSGVYDPMTDQALRIFRAERYIPQSDFLGKLTISSLLAKSHRYNNDHRVKGEDEEIWYATSMRLPSFRTVFASQPIIPGKTESITWEDMTAGCTRIPLTTKIEAAIERIALIYQEVRNKYRAPLPILSGYIPPATAREIHGTRSTRHAFGDALDIQCHNIPKLLEIVKANPKIVGIGIGAAKNFVHIDAGRGERRIFVYQ